MTSPTTDRRQGLVGNTPIKASADVATTANITLSGEQVIDGFTTNASRVLVKNQTDATQNGIYDSSSAAWTRSYDANGNYDLAPNTLISVINGAQGGSFFGLSSTKPVTIGTSALNWVLSAGVALGLSLISATGTSLVGNKLSAIQSATRLLNLKLAEWVSVTDFNNNDGTQVLGDYNGTTGRDNLTGFQAAINYCQLSSAPGTYGTNSPASGSPTLFIPSGNYKVNGTLTITAKMHIRGDGPAESASGSRVRQFNNAVDLFQVNPPAVGMSWSIEDVAAWGTAGGAGHLIHVTGATGQCNAIRIQRCYLATPPSLAIAIDRGDDVLVAHNTIDVSNGSAMSFGTSAAANVVSALRVINNDFFEIPTRCILLYNIVGALIAGNHVTRQSATRTNYFIDAANTLPYQLKDIVVAYNVLNSVDCLIFGTAVNNLTITSNDGILMGAGAGAIHSNVEFTGTCTNVVVGLNNMSGNWDTKNFYNDAGATVSGGAVNGNNIVATGGAGTAIVANNFTGKLAQNNLAGFSRNYTCADYIAAGLPLAESQTIAYSAAMATDASLGSICTITATNGTAFTINNPTNPSGGQFLEYTIRNTSGGALGVLTLGALFKIGAAWVQPANGFSRAILFRWNGTNWVEKYRSAADISN